MSEPSRPPVHAAAPGHAPHVLPPRVLLGTAGALLALTAVTVTTSRLELGAASVVVALAIAATKAALVALFFMHLRYEGQFLAVILGASALFVTLFVTFVVFDTTQYQPDLRASEAAAAAARH